MKTLIIMLIALLTACANHTAYQENEEEDMTAPGLPGNKKSGWSASGKLTQLNRLTKVSMQANFVDAPQNYTVQFKLAGDLRLKRTEAEIVWSVEGNDVRRLVSVADGVSVQGSGQGVKVTIYDVSNDAVPVGVSADYVASVQLVSGTRGSTGNPPVLSGDRASILAGGSQTFQIPTNAGITSVGVSVGTGGNPIAEFDIAVTHQDSGATSLSTYDPRQFYWVPLTPGTTQIQITNFGASTIEVKINYGIDG